MLTLSFPSKSTTIREADAFDYQAVHALHKPNGAQTVDAILAGLLEAQPLDDNKRAGRQEQQQHHDQPPC